MQTRSIHVIQFCFHLEILSMSHWVGLYNVGLSSFHFVVLTLNLPFLTFSSKMKTSQSFVSQHNFMQAAADATSSSLRNFAPIAFDSSVRMIVDEWISKRSAIDIDTWLHLHNIRSSLHKTKRFLRQIMPLKICFN